MKTKRVLMLTIVALMAATMSLGWTVPVEASESAKEDQSWRYQKILNVRYDSKPSIYFY